jgi:uncharacterized caspase-like protein
MEARLMRNQTSDVRPSKRTTVLFRVLGLAFFICCTQSVFPLANPAFSQARVALVIGNGTYQNVPMLANPENDATGIAKTLERLGFDVLLGVDADSVQLRNLVQEFGGMLGEADIALFFYAGHGFQVDGRNYFVPVDADIQSETDVEFEAMDLDLVLRQMDRRAKVKIVLLDACRNNPFETVLTRSMGRSRSAGSLGRGLAPVQPAGGALIGFATDPGAVAFDGVGRNSPFTGALLRHLATPGLEINLLMTRVRADVFAETQEKQRPWTTSSLIGELYLSAPKQDRTAEDIAAWKAADIAGEKSGFEQYLKVFPDGLFHDLATQRLAALAPQDQVAALAPVSRSERSQTDTTPRTPPADSQDGVALALQKPTPSLTSTDPAAGSKRFRDCPSCPEMVVMPPGVFAMGANFGPAPEKPQMRKQVEHPFALGLTEVTRRQWKMCVRAEACRDLPGPADDVPAAGLSYDDANDYATWLSGHTGRSYRLPSEAEWEYAARGGRDLRHPTGPVMQPKAANYDRPDGAPLTVASYPANDFGLHDLAGNVWEWVKDCGARYDVRNSGVSPVTATPCLRVLRGGGFRSTPNQLRSSNRFFMEGDKRRDDFGLRLAADIN